MIRAGLQAAVNLSKVHGDRQYVILIGRAKAAWYAVAVSGPRKVDSFEDIFNDHAHKVVYTGPSLWRALRASYTYLNNPSAAPRCECKEVA